MDFETIKTGATWAIIVIGVVGLVLAIIIKKVIGKVISLVLAAILIFFGWQQRSKVVDFADDVKGKACAAEPSFFGIDVSLPADWCKK